MLRRSSFSALRRALLCCAAPVAALALAGCGGPHGGVADELSAQYAYLGLDGAVGRAIQLGFDGFNAASSANIPDQTGDGDAAGTMVVGGKVDQGASSNKGMRLEVTLTGYSDGPVGDGVDIVYDGGPNAFDLNFKGLPDADLTGTLSGDFVMSGDLAGPVTLDLSISGKTEDDGTGKIRRVAGSVHVTGTATSNYGTFAVDVSL